MPSSDGSENEVTEPQVQDTEGAEDNNRVETQTEEERLTAEEAAEAERLKAEEAAKAERRAAEEAAKAEQPASGRRQWSELIKSLRENKWVSINPETQTAEQIDVVEMPEYLQTATVREQMKEGNRDNVAHFTNEVGKCGLIEGSRLYKLRKQLIAQLKGLVTDQDAKDTCIGRCQEDDDLLTMLDNLDKVMGKGSDKCQLETFDKNPKLKLLAAKKAMMERANFSFLHSECESDINCNPFEDEVIPKELMECSGIYEGEIFFNSPQMAAIGKALAGKQRNGQSPAALGHASNLYPTGVIAPGTNPEQLWVNICYLVSIPLSSLSEEQQQVVIEKRKELKDDAKTNDEQQDLSEVAYLDTKWVPANVMEQEKFITLKKLKKAITDQKRTILRVNQRIVQLQMQMLNVQGNDEFYDNGDSFGYTSEQAIEHKVKHSVERARYALLRKAADRNQRNADEIYQFQLQGNGIGNQHNAALRRIMGRR